MNFDLIDLISGFFPGGVYSSLWKWQPIIWGFRLSDPWRDVPFSVIWKCYFWIKPGDLNNINNNNNNGLLFLFFTPVFFCFNRNPKLRVSPRSDMIHESIGVQAIKNWTKLGSSSTKGRLKQALGRGCGFVSEDVYIVLFSRRKSSFKKTWKRSKSQELQYFKLRKRFQTEASRHDRNIENVQATTPSLGLASHERNPLSLLGEISRVGNSTGPSLLIEWEWCVCFLPEKNKQHGDGWWLVFDVFVGTKIIQTSPLWNGTYRLPNLYF